MPEDTVVPTSASSCRSKSKATRGGKVDKKSFEDTITSFTEATATIHENINSFLSSWISKFPGIPMAYASDVTQAGCSAERTWLQSAAQTTGESDVESVISNVSSLDELDESFTDLQFDAGLQAIRNDIQTETEGLLRILDDIHLGNEKSVPGETSVELRKRARAIVSIFGDDVPSLRCKAKVQEEEMGRLATERNASAEDIFKIGNQKSEEIKMLEWRHHSEIQKLCQENKSLKQENKALRQKIQTFKDKRRADIMKLTNIREKFEAVAIQIESMRKAKAAKQQPSSVLQEQPLADAEDQFAPMDRGEKSVINLKKSRNNKSTTKKFKIFAGGSESNGPVTKHDSLVEVQRRTNELQTHAARRRGEATAARNAELSRTKSLAEHASICKTLRNENATIKDRVCELSAQLKHARIGSKCIRDALAERNEELKGFNDAKDKVNWVLREALVTVRTQVETLGRQLKMQSTSGSISKDPLRSHTQEASQPCAQCPYLELELSTIRNNLAIHRQEKKKAEEKLKQAKLKTLELENDAIRAPHNYDNLAKNSNERNSELEKILQATKKRLNSSIDETRSLARQVTKCRTELESYLGVSYKKEGVTIHDLTRFFCLMSEQKEAILKQRVEKAEQKVVNEIERHRKFHAAVQKDVKDLIRKTGGLWSLTHELGKWAVEDFKEPST